MPQLTALYTECRQVYDALPHRKGGSHGRQVRGKYVKEGDTINAFVGATHVMSLMQDSSPARETIGLQMPGKGSEVLVFADPTRWEHNQVVVGATEDEVRRFLAAIQRRHGGQQRLKPHKKMTK